MKPIIKFVDMSQRTNTFQENKPKSYHYELGKLSTKRNFEMFSSFLDDESKKNEEVAVEIENMRNNLVNDVEYYSSYYLLRKLLKH